MLSVVALLVAVALFAYALWCLVRAWGLWRSERAERSGMGRHLHRSKRVPSKPSTQQRDRAGERPARRDDSIP